MNIEWKAVQGTIIGLLLGSIIGATAVIKYPNKVNDLELKGSVNAETGSTEVTEISYKNGRCVIYKEDYRLIGMPGTFAKLSGGYSCRDIATKDDVVSLKKAC